MYVLEDSQEKITRIE